MSFLCEVCDRWIIENEFEYKKYIKNILLKMIIWMSLIKY